MYGRLTAIYANILQLRFQDTFAGLPPQTLNAISRNNFLARLGQVLMYAGGRLVLNIFEPVSQREDIRGKVWLYVVSKNNYESLQFLQAQLPGAVFVAGQNKDIGRYNGEVNRLSTRRKILFLFRFPFLLAGLYRLKGHRALRFFDLIFQATGYYELSLGYLQKYKPRAIIFANDHNTDPRALLLAARQMGVPTIYIQHASVSTSFPALEFDLNLLEGQDALDKYQACGPISGEVKFIGMPKADAYARERNYRPGINHVGIAINTLDDLKAVQALLAALVYKLPGLKFTLRPHPSDKRDFSFLYKLNNHIGFSDSRQEPVFEFLKNQDALIAADSSIHLEATLLNLFSIYYRFGTSNFKYDYYGYAEKGLVEIAANGEETVALLQKYAAQRPQTYLKAKYYNALIGTENEGRSHELALSYIREFLNHTPAHG